MKVLRIWHAAVVPEYRKKIRALSDLPDVELELLIPPAWKEAGKEVHYLPNHDVDAGYNIRVGKILNGNNIRRYVFLTGLFESLKTFRPDVIDLEEEPFAFVTAQVLWYRKLLGLKSPVIFHSAHNVRRPMGAIFDRVRGYAFRECEAAVVRNSETEALIREQGFTKPIFLSGNGIDLENFYPEDAHYKAKLKRRLGLEGKTVIGYVGKLKGSKGVLTLLKAFAPLAGEQAYDLALLMLGTGSLKEEIVQFARQNGFSDRLKLVGRIDHEETPDYYRAMDICVLPSETTDRWKESFGRALIEAMASGVPVIGSSSGAIPQTIGRAGLIFKERDHLDLAAKIERCLNSYDLRKELTAQGLRRAKVFSWESLAKINHQAYEAALENR